MLRHKVCYDKLSMMYSFASAALRSDINIFPYEEHEKNKYIKEMEEELFKLSSSIPRNCKYPDHYGTCRMFCDCGCPNGMDICTSQGD